MTKLHSLCRYAAILGGLILSSDVAGAQSNGTFTVAPLPVEAQFAPIYSALAGDFDGDGHTDLLAADKLEVLRPSHFTDRTP